MRKPPCGKRPVRLIDNSGGYRYGVMGPTHLAVKDHGILLPLPKMMAFPPVFDLP